MKTYLVFDVPASSGGALTILNQYYEKALNDKSNNWIFVVSTPELIETHNIKVLRFPWIKKSWLHRLWFDMFFEKNILKKHPQAEMISLQNVSLKTKKKHTIYLHNSLLFLDVNYSIIKEFRGWLYNKITRHRIKKSLYNTNNNIIVQTNWIKDSAINKLRINPNNITIVHPTLNKEIFNYRYEKRKDILKLFYPASYIKFKNHKIIIEALKLLENKNNLEVIFTLNMNDKNIKWMLKEIEKYKLPIKMVGKLTYSEVLNLYKTSTLIFPSYLETFGLPLLEARTIGCPIIASDKPFSKEILNGYNNYALFNEFDPHELSYIIKKMLKEINYDKTNKCD